VVAGLLALPLLVAAVQALVSAKPAAWDWALLELRIRDVGGADTPLLGPYSRYGWNHPGPLLFWLLAPLYRIFGADSAAMYAGSAVVNLAAVLAVVLVVRRLGGRRLLVVTALALTLFTASAGSILADPWNPYLTLLPFAVFLFAAAGLASGDLVMAPVALVAGSFVVQSHIGYAVFVVLVSLLAAVVGGVMLWRGGNPRRRLDRTQRWLVTGVSIGVVLVAWAVPLAEQVTGDPGNVTEILDYFSTATEEPIGFAQSLGFMGLELAPIGPWLGGHETSNSFGVLTSASPWWAVPGVGLLALAGWLSWRRRDLDAGALIGVAGVAVAAGVIAVSRITGITYFYLVRPWWVVAMVTWVTIGWVLIKHIPLHGHPRIPPALSGIALGVAISIIGVGSVLNSVEMADGPQPDPNRAAIDVMDDAILASLEQGATYAVMPAGQSWGEALASVVNLLNGSGRPAFTHPYFVTEYGQRRVFGEPGVPDAFAGTVIVATSEAVTDIGGRNGLILLASYDPLTPDERADLETLRTQVITELRAQGRDDLTGFVSVRGFIDALVNAGVNQATLERIVELEERGIRVAVYLDPRPVTTDELLRPG
jgi:hypothetical protein